MRLKDKVAIVTGSSQGIGRAIATRFAAEGAKVAVTGLGKEALEETAAFLRNQGGQAIAIEADVRYRTDVDRMVDNTLREWGRIDVLVNNAGKDDRHAMGEVEPDYWRRALALNLDHQFFATQAVSKGMAERGRGSVIMLGSISWMRGRPGMVGYTTAKAAINGMTKTLARELGPSGIRVNCIVPGAILTERQEKFWLTPELTQQFLDLQALKFRLNASHVAKLALFVASDESAGCTGSNFVVDAGLTQN